MFAIFHVPILEEVEDEVGLQYLNSLVRAITYNTLAKISCVCNGTETDKVDLFGYLSYKPVIESDGVADSESVVNMNWYDEGERFIGGKCWDG